MPERAGDGVKVPWLSFPQLFQTGSDSGARTLRHLGLGCIISRAQITPSGSPVGSTRTLPLDSMLISAISHSQRSQSEPGQVSLPRM
jgi:hypothetical protein